MLLYTLFPRLAGTMPQWLDHSARAAKMGFDWIHLNPMQYPGFSNSLYAVKDFYRLNPAFIPHGCTDPMGELSRTVRAMQAQGLRVMLDLVINHTSKDSPLIREKPRWFRYDAQGRVLSPSVVDPGDPSQVTVWGDLAEVDNAHSPERSELWAYWTALVQFYLDVGFDGFRCDAAYKVPLRLWQQLIGSARQRKPDVCFAAETLGCQLPEIKRLEPAGFTYLFNSGKWWNFDKPWCLEQHEMMGRIGPSIGFPESHDTPRLMAETGGLLQVQKQRYAFAAAFSAGLLMPIGFELGFRRALHVVETKPEDWEHTGVDLTSFIAQVNRAKREHAILGIEGHWTVVTDLDSPTLVLRKAWPELAPMWLLINKDWHQTQLIALPHELRQAQDAQLLRVCREPLQGQPVAASEHLHLDPAEVVFVVQAPSSESRSNRTRRRTPQ